MMIAGSFCTGSADPLIIVPEFFRWSAEAQTWMHVGGGNSELMLAWASGCTLLPEGLSYDDAAPIFCAGYTVMSGLRNATPRPGERVAVLGLGGLGHLALQFSRAVGLETWAVTGQADKVKELKQRYQQVGVADRGKIFNTDLGSQFTSREYTGRLEEAGVAVSRDGRGRALDNVFVERLWRSVKYEDIYIKDYARVEELESGLRSYFWFYDEERPHQSLDYRTPGEVHRAGIHGRLNGEKL